MRWHMYTLSSSPINGGDDIFSVLVERLYLCISGFSVLNDLVTVMAALPG